MYFVGIEKISLVDFDGYISTVLFTEKCNIWCSFCQNSQLVFKKNEEIPWEKIKSFLKKYAKKVDAVVITGGEPLIYNDLFEKIKEIKEMGFLVKLDTNGTKPEELKKLLKNNLIDYVAIDIKNDFQNYDKIVKAKEDINKIVSNIKKTIKYLKESSIKFEFRTTIVEEFHKTDNLINIANFIKPYCQKYFLQHYSFRNGCIKEYHEIKKNKAEKILQIIKKIIPNTFLRGY